MKRFFDWQSRLAEYLAAAERRPFSWIRWNCAIFTCDGVAAITGDNPADLFTETVSAEDPAAAFSACRRFAGAGVAAVAEKIGRDLGCPEIAPGLAGRGDVMAFETDGIKALGLVDLNGRDLVTVAPKAGLARVSIAAVVPSHAWRIG